MKTQKSSFRGVAAKPMPVSILSEQYKAIVFFSYQLG